MNINNEFIKYVQTFTDRIKPVLESSPEGWEHFIFCVDIFGFRNINRLYGHEAGNRLLSAIDAFMERNDDILLHTRFYSDHFLYFVRYEKGTSDEEIIADRQSRVKGFLLSQQQKYPACRLNFPCGFSRIENADVERAIEEANFARKEAKRTGEGKTLSFNSELIKDISLQRQLEESLNLALRDEQFCFFLQPKVDLTTGEICGAEALVRRIGRDDAIIPPDAFLPAMEASGAVTELDLLVCRQVCRFLAERIAKGLPVVRTSVNLSRLHTQNPDVADAFHSIVSQYSLSPELIQFELTETIFLNDFSGAKKLIDRLRFFGYSVAIDDFGSGYAGINIWQELDFDVLKLDKRFLNENPERALRNEAILPNVIIISQRLKIGVLCEGVETAEQCRHLLRLGCRRVQGYYFSKPVPPEEFYESYEKLQGRYSLNFPEQKKLTGEERKQKHDLLSYKKSARRPRFFVYALTFLFLAIFVSTSVAVTFSFYRKSTQQQFQEMTTETLNAYASEQKSSVLAGIVNEVDTLKALSVIIGENPEKTYIDAYLKALNSSSASNVFQYSSASELEILVSKYPENAQPVAALKKGETVVSDVYYSTSRKVWVFSIAVPVFNGSNAFTGGIRGLIPADVLTSLSPYPPAQGKVTACYLTKGTGEIVSVADGMPGGSVFELCETDYERKNLQCLYSISGACDGIFDVNSIRLEQENTSPIYVSLASLDYNDWHLAIFLTADAAAARSRAIVRNSFVATGILLGATAVACISSILLFNHQQKRLSSEERRYLLLEQFSDTVLFDYDIAKDTIRFTSNAEKLFLIHDLVQSSFLKNFDQSYIYAADATAFRKMLLGASSQRETRIRLLNPESRQYFWCLVRFLYVRTKGVPTSVVGKIVDIDNLKQREDKLLEIAETDGLTGFFNKISVAKQVREQLESVPAGSLFMIDIDDFKKVNDTYGHFTGDKTLRLLAEEIRSAFGENGVFGRVGGDELIVFSPECKDRSAAKARGDKLLKRIAKVAEKDSAFPFVSIGIAVCPADGTTFEELFLAADRAMYEAKRQGKNRCSFDANR